MGSSHREIVYPFCGFRERVVRGDDAFWFINRSLLMSFLSRVDQKASCFCIEAVAFAACWIMSCVAGLRKEHFDLAGCSGCLLQRRSFTRHAF